MVRNPTFEDLKSLQKFKVQSLTPTYKLRTHLSARSLETCNTPSSLTYNPDSLFGEEKVEIKGPSCWKADILT